MTTLREAAQRALEALDETDTFHRNLPDQRARRLAAMAALRDALAQQVEPLNLRDPAVQKRLATQWGYVPAAQAEPVEPVAWVNQANLASARLTRDRGGQGDTHTWSETRSNYHGVPLYTAPPQRKPLPKHDQHCVDVPGYGLMAVRLVRAVERAHGIGEEK